MAIVIQGNLQHSRLAQDFLSQRAYEWKADLLVIFEQYTNMQVPAWYANYAGMAAIWVKDKVRHPVT